MAVRVPQGVVDTAVELHVACRGNIVVVPLLDEFAGSGQELVVEVHADEDTRWALEILEAPEPTVPAVPEVVAAPESEPLPGKEVFEAQTDREGSAALGPYTVTDDHLRVDLACVGPGRAWARTSLGGETPVDCGAAQGRLATGSVEGSPPPGELTVEIEADPGVRWSVEVFQYPDAG